MRISDWSSDVCSTDLGNQPVQLQWDRSRDPSYESNSNRHRVKKPFSEVAARLRSHEPSNDFYVTANNRDENRDVFAPLFGDVGEIPGILKRGGAREGFLWIGPRGTITPWHHDLTNNLLRSEEHTSELQSLMRISYAVFCLKKKNT